LLPGYISTTFPALQTHPAYSRRFLAACLVVIATLARQASADIELQSVPPPQPMPVQAKTYLGESVEITLSGVSRSGSSLQFLIRRQPELGTLSAVRLTSSKTAVVTYTHNQKAGTGVDRFRYAVSAPGIGVSTPVEVTISVSERPSIFVATSRIDFPDTPVGRAALKTVEVQNKGGGTITGKLAVPAPWVIVDGDGSYVLGPGDARSITVSFVPSEARQFSGNGSFSHSPEAGVALVGLGFNPVEVVPREVRLETDGRSEVRTGGFLLRNVSDEDIELKIEAPGEIIVQNSILSPAHSEQQVALHTKAGFLAGLESRLKLTGKSVSLDVPLHVAAAPAHVVVEPSKIDFGTLDAGRTGRAKFTVKNVGGSPADLVVKMPPGAALSPDPTSGKVPPGGSRTFEVRLSRPLPGEFAGQLVIEAGDSMATLDLTAKFRQQWQSASGDSRPSSASEITYSDIPPVMEIGVMKQTRTELELAWKKPSPNVAGYTLYMRTVSFDTKGNASFRYEKLDRVKPRYIRDVVRVTLTGLRPGESVTLLVVGYDANGTPSRPSPPLTVATKPKPVFHIPWLWVCVIALVVIAVLIVRERRRIHAASDAEFEARFEGMNH
jgi:hypothetical protein